MKAFDIVHSDKMILKYCILQSFYIWPPWSSYTNKRNHLNNFDNSARRLHKGHFPV